MGTFDVRAAIASRVQLKRKAVLGGSLLVAAALLSGCGASLTVDQPAGSFTSEPIVGGKLPDSRSIEPQAPALGAALHDPSDKKPVPGKAKLAVGGAPQDPTALTAVATPGNPGYKIGPLDVIEVSVFKVPDLSKTVQVAESGTINLPLVGEVQTVGKTAQDVERDLTAKLGAKYLQSPQVTVFVKEFNSQRVTVEGAVKKPGIYPLRGKTTLMQTLAMSEGVDTQIASSTIVVFRQTSGKKSAARFELDDIRSGTAADPEIVAGDLVVVDTSAAKQALNNFIRVLPVASVFKPF